MSITFTIQNNRQWCEEFDEIRYCKQVCPYCDGHHSESCEVCTGSGKVVVSILPHEINFNNGNFVNIFSILLNRCPGPSEAIWPQRLLPSLNKIPPSFVERLSAIFGIPLESLQVKFDTILDICEEAARREEMVVWN